MATTNARWRRIERFTGNSQTTWNVGHQETFFYLYGYCSGLKFLDRLSKDLGLPEAKEYEAKLKKAEKVKEIRERPGSAYSKRSAQASRGGGSTASAPLGHPPGSRGSLRTASSARSNKINLSHDDSNEPYEVSRKPEYGKPMYSTVQFMV